MTVSVKDLYLKVWRFREQAEAYWPTPAQNDSWRFCFTEAAECLEKELGLNPAYQRNNPKPPDPDGLLDELADLSIMLLTTLGPAQTINKLDGIHGSVELDALCRWVSKTWEAFGARRRQPDFWVKQTIAIVTAISQYPGMDLPVRMDDRLARIKLKHESKHEVSE